MNIAKRRKYRVLNLVLLAAALLLSTGSLSACGKKGNLEKPGQETEKPAKKPKVY